MRRESNSWGCGSVATVGEWVGSVVGERGQEEITGRYGSFIATTVQARILFMNGGSERAWFR